MDKSTTSHSSTARQVCSRAPSANGSAVNILPALDAIVADRNDIAMILETAKTRAGCRDFAAQHFIDLLGSGKFVGPASTRINEVGHTKARSFSHDNVQESQ
jgi:hypothetical protein